ncbi:MAG: methylthioribulose 1-phosphate dehydratase [Pseudomonadota bacterium]
MDEAVREIATMAGLASSRGWVPASSGNFSVRLDDGTIAVTVSGRDKGTIGRPDVTRLTAAGAALDAAEPSAEAALHLALYARDGRTSAVAHTHSRTATLLSLEPGSPIVLAGLELLKAFAGIDSHETAVAVPVFDNDQDIARLAARVDAHMDEHGAGVAYLIRGHGLYTWGESAAAVCRHLDALEFLFDVYWRRLSRA